MPANDLFASGAFSRAAEVLRASPRVAMVYGDCRILDEDGAVTRIDRPGSLDIDRLFWTHFLMLQSSYIRRAAFERVGMFDGTIKGPGDTEWLMRMVAKYPSESFRYVPEAWSSYRFGQSLEGVCFRDCRQNARVMLAAHERFLSAPENAADCGMERHAPVQVCTAGVPPGSQQLAHAARPGCILSTHFANGRG